MFSASQKKADQFLKQKEEAWQQSLEKTARLKARRLAQEAASADATEASDSKKETTSSK
jgi:hypothetical protein